MLHIMKTIQSQEGKKYCWPPNVTESCRLRKLKMDWGLYYGKNLQNVKMNKWETGRRHQGTEVSKILQKCVRGDYI